MRPGDHYFFHVPESLIDSPLSLKQVEKMTAITQANTEVEKSNPLFRDIKQDRVLAITKTKSKTQQEMAKLPVKLIPMEVKQYFKIKRKQSKDAIDQLKNESKSRKSFGLRQSFFTTSATTEDELKRFASENEFKPCTPKPLRFQITVKWRSREIKIVINEKGVLENIHHRKVLWLSTTFKQHSKSQADDGRVYLETKQQPDEGESCLYKLIQNLRNRSTLNAELMKLINQDDADASQLPANPLTANLLNLEWKFSTIRIHKCKLAFKNIAGDVLELNKIFQGEFDSMKAVKWLPDKQNELEIDVNMTNRSNEELCRVSYDLSLKLFEFIKTKKE